ncbi:MAG: RNA-directed DNA polymerase [Clostridia bacterium]
MKQILKMNSDNAKKYFLKEKSYFNVDLPPYFKFQDILNSCEQSLLVEKDIKNLYKTGKFPKNCENVNYKFLCNKDGKFAWRPFQIIHPLLYVNLVNQITQNENWNKIQKRFVEFKKNKNIVCCSDLLESDTKLHDKFSTIMNWWGKFEQQSIELSAQYSKIACTDITDCYGSIYTHTIVWAIEGRDIAKQKKNDKKFNKTISPQIDKLLQEMSYGETNGIPQGSALMDFIAEIVLGYADLLLTEKLETLQIKNYKILRYRDDYRIFSNSNVELEIILKNLTLILSDLKLKLNSSKTIVNSDDVIGLSIKKDKLYWLEKEVILEKLNLQKQLLIIRELGMKFPNCGSLEKALNQIHKKVITFKRTPNSVEKLISIIIDIMYNNPRTFPVCAAILSKFLEYKTISFRERIAKIILDKFEKIPNTDYLEVWLQRIFINKKILEINNVCKSVLYNKVNNPTIKIWNSDWLKNPTDEKGIIDSSVLNNISFVIDEDEFGIIPY